MEDIGLDGSRIYARFSAVADSIRVNGQDHATLLLATNTDTLSYTMTPQDNFARITAYFPEGEVIYSNPFARYNPSVQDSPFNDEPQKINWFLTVLFNLGLLAVLYGLAVLLIKLIRK